MEHTYTITLDDSSPFFDPSEGIEIVAFTRRAGERPIVEELQWASNEGTVSGDFQTAHSERPRLANLS